MPTVISFDTLTDLYKNLSLTYVDTSKTAFAYKPSSNAAYKKIKWDQVTSDVESVAAYLVDRGVEKGDRVALLSENRYEWAVVDMALQLLGAVNVSLYTTLPVDQCQYIIEDSGSTFFFASTGIQIKKAAKILGRLSHLNEVIAFEKPRSGNYLEHENISLFEDVISIGKSLMEERRSQIEAMAEEVKPADLATLIYTSGTTGKPKGAMLTHKNIVSNIKACHQHIDVRNTDRCLSFLPLCHAFERTAGYYAMMAGGAEIYYAESVDTVARNMTEAYPTLIISVPRLFEKIYNLVVKNIEEGTSLKQTIFNWGLKVGKQYADGERGLTTLQKKLADKIVFDKLKQRTGGKVRFFISGGAALSPKIGQFFKSAGFHILEGYGLTETSPVISCNKYGKEVVGTVGEILPTVTVGIQRVDDKKVIAKLDGEEYPTDLTTNEGEILVKGPNVMKGYWNKSEETAEVIDDKNWFHTGDIGKFEAGQLKITDRIKHMIVNAGGKNVYPGPIEDRFKTNKWIDQIVIVGEQKPYMAALVVPDFDVLETYAEGENIPFSDWEELIQNDQIKKIYNTEIRAISKELASHEKVRDFRLIPKDFTVESGELTPTLKVKRRIIEKRYADLIEDIFKDVD